MKKLLAIMLCLFLLAAFGAAASAEETAVRENAVTELYSAEGTYTDSIGNVETYSFHVPQLHVDTPAAQEINQEIAERFGSYVKEQIKNMAEGYSLWSWYTGWHAYWYGGELFLLIEADLEGGFHDIAAFGYDFEKDCRVSNKAILQQLGISEEKYMENLREKTQLMFEDMYGSLPDKEAFGYDELLQKTMDWLDADQPMFIDGNGQIETIVKIASVAGAEWYYHLVTPFSYG